LSLIANLFHVIKEHPLKEKILITNSHSQGHQWLEWISRELGPISNVSIQSMEEFVWNYGKLGLHKEDKKLLNSSETYWLVYSIIHELLEKQEFHFETNLLSPGFIDAFHRAIMDLRHAGLIAENLIPDLFEQKDKGEFIKLLLQGYEDYLSHHQLVDFPGLHPILSSISQVPKTQKPIVLVHEHVYLSYIEQEMLTKITEGQYEILKGDRPFFHQDADFPAEKAEFFHSTGVLSELKEVFRRMAGANAPLDHVEWILSDYEGYVSAAYALFQKYEIPVTFSKGIPMQFSTIGKAAYTYLKWLESNFHIDSMVQAFKDYSIQLPKEESEYFTAGKIAYLLGKIGIGWGQDRYSLILKASQNEEKESDQKALQWADHFFQQLFAHIPNKNEFTPKAIIRGLTHFLETYSPPKSKEEKLILNSILEIQTGMGSLDQKPTDLDSALDFVKHLLEGIRYQVSPVPEPGKVHFSSIQDGGYSGRDWTYVVGMDDSNWSVKTHQDPILLDEERQRISPYLKTSIIHSKERLQERNSRLGCIRKNCTFSLCSSTLIENEAKHPGYEMLQVYRSKCGNHDANMDQLFSHMGEQIYFSGSNNQLKASELEVWLQYLIDETKNVRDGKSIILGHYQSISNGELAILSRKGTEVTPYDGVLKEGLMKEHYDSLIFSATQLEKFSSCSLQFYFNKVLGIHPPEKKEFDRTEWLGAMEKGNLLHYIFYKYMMDRLNSGKSNALHNRELLWKITNDTINEYREKIPTPSNHIAEKEIAEIYQDVEVFIKQEEIRHSTPKYFELQLHPDGGYFDVEVSESLHIPLRGYVDRVDEIEPHVYRIYDYKTGNPKKFEVAKYFAKGTQLQHALYALAVEQWLRKGDDPDAVVKEAVYYFPTQKGLGKEVIRQQNRRELLAELMESIIKAIQKGTFLPTDQFQTCTYCDYKEVCGDHSKWRKDKEVNDARLQSVLGVRKYD
jgi:ATP-dependent helicase/nuclease subunit B